MTESVPSNSPVFDDGDREICSRVINLVEGGLGKKCIVKARKEQDHYEIVFKGDLSSVSWRTNLADVIRECLFLKNLRVIFASETQVKDLYKKYFEERPDDYDAVRDQLLIQADVQIGRTCKVGSNPPPHEFAHEKQTVFSLLADVRFAEGKVNKPKTWTVDAPALESFARAVTNDNACEVYTYFDVPKAPGGPYELFFEGMMLEFSQSLLEIATFGHDETVKDVVCEIGADDHSRRISVTLCGGKVIPLPKRKEYRR
jgi:hypothetical protein